MARSWVSRSIEALSELVWRPSCGLCDRPATTQGLCAACDRKLQATESAPEQRWSLAIADRPLLAYGIYDGALKRAIAALKYDGQTRLARPLGQALGRLWLEPAPEGAIGAAVQQAQHLAPVVIPIPLHDNRQRQRGFNQAELLAEGFCDVTGLRLMRSGLRRVRDTKAQFSLGRSDRVANLRDAFAIGPALLREPPQRALLLDDIYTSGATVQAAIAGLRAAGWSVAAVAVVARSVGAMAPHPKRRDS
jgi:ComF family protein